MPIRRSTSKALKVAGWEEKAELPHAVVERLEAESPAAIKLFDAVTSVYEIFHHSGRDRWVLISDGGSSFSVNAEGMLLATANPERLDTENGKDRTMVFTIGLSDKTVSDWLEWVGVRNNLPDLRPDRGYNYVS